MINFYKKGYGLWLIIPFFIVICIRMIYRLTTLLCIALFSCAGIKTPPTTKNNLPVNVLENLLQANPAMFKKIMDNRQNYRVQIIYTQISRNKQNVPTFTDYTFNLDSNQYFYPASMVKMPAALLALQKLGKLQQQGIERTTAMITDSSFTGQQAVLTQPTAADSRPTVEQYIREIFAVSDNEAYNRLYEFLGQQYINEQLHAKGYTSAQILHRLSVPLTEEENRHTNAISFYDTAGNLLYRQPAAYNNVQYQPRQTQLGNGYYSNGQLVNTPFNFSQKNRLCLTDLQQMLRSVLFPLSVPARQRFNLSASDYRFVYKSMSSLPREVTYPEYDSTEYWDAYVKFLLYGSEKGSMPSNIRIFNKVGDAYGFLTDVAYIVDFETKVEFMLGATIFCNEKGIFNSDDYQYDSIGFPFMKNLGRVVYDYELKRKRKYLPDLSEFTFDYSR